MGSALARHGIKNISDMLNFKRQGSVPLRDGGFGSIYQGQLPGVGLVAVKCLDKQCKPEYKHCKHAAHELYTWSKCNYRGILKILGFALDEEFILLVSPWIEKGSLAGYLAHNECDRLKICRELAGTVEYLHDAGIVHGDIKAENMLVSDSEGVKLADFGNATLTKYTLIFTRTSPQFACSVLFTAPEILDESITQRTAKSDIYALGMTILQILTGRMPYEGDSDMRALSKVFRGEFPSRPGFDDVAQEQDTKDNLWELLERCWGQPNDRPTAVEVKHSLIEIENELKRNREFVEAPCQPKP